MRTVLEAGGGKQSRALTLVKGDYVGVDASGDRCQRKANVHHLRVGKLVRPAVEAQSTAGLVAPAKEMIEADCTYSIARLGNLKVNGKRIITPTQPRFDISDGSNVA
jgi:hypothetical protein